MAKLTLAQFEKKYLNQPLDIDNYPLYDKTQCMDVFRAYCRDVLGIPMYAVPGAEYAVDVFYRHPAQTIYFKKIANTPTNMPKPGDVLFLKRYIPSWTGIAGHVAIVHSATINDVRVFHQNYPKSLSNCGFYTFPYRVKSLKLIWTDLVAGWLSPVK